jgi:hypothetical protein
MATWKEAREDAHRLSAANGTDELEAAVHAFLRSHRKLVGVGERLKAHLAHFHKARQQSPEGGRNRPRKP